jgi:hypothetical protein
MAFAFPFEAWHTAIERGDELAQVVDEGVV